MACLINMTQHVTKLSPVAHQKHFSFHQMEIFQRLSQNVQHLAWASATFILPVKYL